MRYLWIFITALFLSGTAFAQADINAKFNLDTQPIWGPTGYDYVDYYYLPDIETYYNVEKNRYYYYEDGHWLYQSTLPQRFATYNIYNSYKVVVNEPRPWQNHKVNKEKYYSYRDRHDQKPIRDSRDSKYFKNKNHPEHSNWVKQNEHDNGNHNSNKQKKSKKNKK